MQSDDEVDDVHFFVQRQVLSGKQSDMPGVPKRRGLTLQKLWIPQSRVVDVFVPVLVMWSVVDCSRFVLYTVCWRLPSCGRN